MDQENNNYLIKIARLERDVAHLKESIKLQASEYERRLTELNHAHAQSVVDKAKFLSADLYHAKMYELEKWRSEIDTWRARIIGIAVGAGAVSGGAVGFILRLFR